jgi:hypothetical protein
LDDHPLGHISFFFQTKNLKEEGFDSVSTKLFQGVKETSAKDSRGKNKKKS